jgi:hypothetical protein
VYNARVVVADTFESRFSCNLPQQWGSATGCSRNGFFAFSALMPEAREGHAVIQALHIIDRQLGQIAGGLTSINSALTEKRYWWERVCNTAQIDGEDSVYDPNGCRM